MYLILLSLRKEIPKAVESSSSSNPKGGISCYCLVSCIGCEILGWSLLLWLPGKAATDTGKVVKCFSLHRKGGQCQSVVP